MQMAFAETYINGLEIPDALCLKLLTNITAFFYKKSPSLMIAYDTKSDSQSILLLEV